MRSIKEVCRELGVARHERFVAISKCNVIAAEHQLQAIMRLTEELRQLRRKRDHYIHNRLYPAYVGSGI